MRVSSSSMDRPPYRSGSRRPSTSRFTPFRTRICTGPNLRDQAVELVADVLCGDVLDARAVLAEQDEAERALLVAEERLPGALAVCWHGAGAEELLHHARVAAGEPERGQEAQRDRSAVRDASPRAGLQRVGERVAEIELRPLAALERVAEADGGLEACAPADELLHGQVPEGLAREQPGLHDLAHPLPALPLGKRGEDGRVDQRVPRPVKRADEVLALREVDARLAAEAGVDLA